MATMSSVFTQQIWNGLVTGSAYVLFAMSLNLIFGVLGVINMAHGELYMLGALLLWTATIFFKINLFLGMIIAILIVVIIGIIINRVSIKPLLNDPLIVMLSTIAVSTIIIYGSTIIYGSNAKVIETPFKGSRPFLGAVLPDVNLVLFSIGIAALIAIHFILKTKIGKAIRATAQDKVGAELIGVDTDRIYTFTIVLASGMAALVGTILGPIWIVYPEMGQDMLLKGFAVVVAAGMGNLRACIIVGLCLGITESLFSQYISMYFKDAYVFGILVVVCLLRPQGLFAKA